MNKGFKYFQIIQLVQTKIKLYKLSQMVSNDSNGQMVVSFILKIF